MHLFLLALVSGFVGATVQLLQVDVFERVGSGEAGCVADTSTPTVPATTPMRCQALCGAESGCQGVLYDEEMKSCALLTAKLGCIPEHHVYWRKRGCQHGGVFDASLGCQCRAGFSGAECEQVGVHTLLGLLTAGMSDPYTEGDWGSWDTCPTGSYAAGMQLRIQPSQGSGDDTAVNAIWLLCRQAWDQFTEVAAISSNTMYWGDLEGSLYCPPDFWVVAFRLYYEPYVGANGDDTGVNGLEVACRGPGMEGSSTFYLVQSETWTSSLWSTWSAECPPGTAVCALDTRVEQDQGSSWGVDIDDAALTEAEMRCCEY